MYKGKNNFACTFLRSSLELIEMTGKQKKNKVYKHKIYGHIGNTKGEMSVSPQASIVLVHFVQLCLKLGKFSRMELSLTHGFLG